MKVSFQHLCHAFDMFSDNLLSELVPFTILRPCLTVVDTLKCILL